MTKETRTVNRDANGDYEIRDDGNNLVATAYTVEDANQIAAIPELLAALRAVTASASFAADLIDAPENSEYRSNIADALAAIAKATT